MDTVSSQDAQLQSLKSQLEQATSAEQKAEIEKQIQDLMKVRLRYFFLSLIFVINVPLVKFVFEIHVPNIQYTAGTQRHRQPVRANRQKFAFFVENSTKFRHLQREEINLKV